MKKNTCVMSAFCLLLGFFLSSCITTQSNGVKDVNDKDVDDKVIRDNIERYSFGEDEEIQAYVLNGKIYYLVNTNKDIKYISDRDIKLYSVDTNRMNIKETTINGIDGIVLTFYDVKVFLEKTKYSGKARVGIFEPSSNRWLIGNDRNRDKNIIEFSYGDEEIGPVIINKSSISRAYN